MPWALATFPLTLIFIAAGAQEEAAPAGPKVLVVNMIPKPQSDEANQDSEPNLAVNPNNPLRIAGSAFTPNPMNGTKAAIYVSKDGGNTWALNAIVPSVAASKTGTRDITLRFGATSNVFTPSKLAVMSILLIQ